MHQNKKEFEQYTLRGITEKIMTDDIEIKGELYHQLSGEVIAEDLDFDLGFYVG